MIGVCFSIINFVLMGVSISMTLGCSRARSRLTAFGSIFVRYIILAIPIIVAIKSSSFNLVSTIIGIFSIQITTLFYYVIVRPVLTRGS